MENTNFNGPTEAQEKTINHRFYDIPSNVDMRVIEDAMISNEVTYNHLLSCINTRAAIVELLNAGVPIETLKRGLGVVDSGEENNPQDLFNQSLDLPSSKLTWLNVLYNRTITKR